MRRIVESAVAAERIDAAREWLAARGAAERVLVVGASAEAAGELVRGALGAGAFGWERASLLGVARSLAQAGLARRGLAPVGALALEALAARVIHALGKPALGRFAPLADRPGFPRACARTLAEIRLAGVSSETLGGVAPDLARIHTAFEAEMEKDRLADRATVLALAADAAQAAPALPLLLLDVGLRAERERDLVAALAVRAPDVLATVPAGDARSRALLSAAIGTDTERRPTRSTTSLARVQAHLFGDEPPEGAPLDDSVVVFSAPGESRECVEIVRHVKKAAEAGTPFDRIAILVRSAEPYRAHVEEALRRAAIPAWLARGSRRPDPAGRAMLALLACAVEGLSARRFAEYLSLGEVPDAIAGAPPPAPPSSDRFFAPDEELLPEAIARAEGEPDPPAEEADPSLPVVAGTLRAPLRWERLLVDAAVIGGRDRWKRRLDGLERELGLDLGELETDDPRAERIRRSIADLGALRDYALPLLDALATFATDATWGEWIDRLSALATRALRRPDRVLGVLAALAPMSSLGPVSLSEVRLVLGRRLADLVVRPDGRPAGKVFVGPAEEARGLSFDVVLVPGLAEKVFPKKVSEDPLLRDDARRALGLPTNDDRIDDERLALRLAVGAATAKLALSYPRLDVELSRPRVPSFYGLEVLRAAEGRLPGFDELARRAEEVGAARIGWPAPESSEDAIDEAEHDLALLRPVLRRKEGVAGTARYLLDANPHLGRALRFRARRWHREWLPADGLVKPIPEVRVALDAHGLSARSYSPTALQNYASCPYKFLLYAVHKLAPREEPEAIEEMDPLQKGSLVHEVLFRLLERLRDERELPVTRANLDRVRGELDAILASVAAEYEEALAPAIGRVWDDGIASIQADLREWLRRASEDESGWTPWRFELSFGLAERRARDPASQDEPAVLDCGIRLRGSIDLVEKSRFTGALRVTDYKTGRARAEKGTVVGGGETLQPVLYALTLEKIFPDTPVESGRLYYLTAKGGYEERTVPLDANARAKAKIVADTIGEALASGFLPAAPAERACEWCDYRPHCGPREEQRARRKNPAPLAALRKLRDLE